jgi:hypothetical protein
MAFAANTVHLFRPALGCQIVFWFRHVNSLYEFELI